MAPHKWVADRRLEQLTRVAFARRNHYARSMVTRPTVAALRELLFWEKRLAFLERFSCPKPSICTAT